MITKPRTRKYSRRSSWISTWWKINLQCLTQLLMVGNKNLLQPLWPISFYNPTTIYMKCQWSRPKKINKIKVSHSSETSPNSFKLILTHRWNHTYIWLHFTFYILHIFFHPSKNNNYFVDTNYPISSSSWLLSKFNLIIINDWWYSLMIDFIEWMLFYNPNTSTANKYIAY